MKEFSDGLPASELKHLWLNMFNYFCNLGQVQTPYFTWAESNANEKNPLFYLISIQFGSCEVRRLNLALKTFVPKISHVQNFF